MQLILKNMEPAVFSKVLNDPGTFTVADGIWGIKDIFVNVYLVEDQVLGGWVLIDAGLKTTAAKIKKAASILFDGKKPKAILLTHGHFDHTGSLKMLAKEWGVPVYTHILEKPFVSGKAKYPPADPTVGGGMMAWMSFIFPRTSAQLNSNLKLLPSDMSVPHLTGWKYIETPGHSPGHVSFYREDDGVLISGDAVVTTVQESALAVMSQYKKLCGPPKYFTIDWNKAKESVRKIAKLSPGIIASGHGKPLSGTIMLQELNLLADDFDAVARPEKGMYLNDPAITDENGVEYIPVNPFRKKLLIAAGISAILLGAVFILRRNTAPDNH
jgi:glyoxylase-like metal-dependent hydrolase (beta-lactamase superfamily II)